HLLPGLCHESQVTRNKINSFSSWFQNQLKKAVVIQAAREYFFSASSLACAEIWKAK
ncbi:hypothetical protein MKW98_022124, partial [Papaver atlanticum]